MSNSGKPTKPGKLSSNNNENKTPHLLSQPRHHRPDVTQEDRSTSASIHKKTKGSRQTAPGRRLQRPKTTGSPMDGTNTKTKSPGTGNGVIGTREPPGKKPGKMGLTDQHRGRHDKPVRRTGMARSDSPYATQQEVAKHASDRWAEANQPVASATLPHTPQLRRLHDIVGHLENLAKQGLPTMLEAFQRSDYQTKMHDDFHNDEATAQWPRVGNWNLALTGSLLCPYLRVKYNNVRKLDDFMESFTVCKGREQPVADWFPQYTELVQLVSDLVGACSQAVHDSLQWNMNPAELIHTIRVSEMEKAHKRAKRGTPTYNTSYEKTYIKTGHLSPHHLR